MASAKRPKGMPAGLKNTPANRKQFRKLTSKKAGGALPTATKSQNKRRAQAERGARARSKRADAAVRKANASGKVGAKKSSKMFRAQAKARRLSSSAGGSGG